MKVGNNNKDSFLMACIKCGTTRELTLTAHRDTSGKVTGWLVACGYCQKSLQNDRLEIKEGKV